MANEYIDLMSILLDGSLTLNEDEETNGVPDYDVNDERWNTDFKKARAQTSTGDLWTSNVIITVQSQGDMREHKTGYLKYKDGSGFHDDTTKNLPKRLPLLHPERDFTVVNDKEQATVFTKEDAEKVLIALKGKKFNNAPVNAFSTEVITSDERNINKDDLPKQIFKAYFNKLLPEWDRNFSRSKGSHMELSDYISKVFNTIYQICAPLSHPLVGNTFLRIFAFAAMHEYLKDHKEWLTNRSVEMIRKLIVGKIFSSLDLINPQTFKAWMVFNPNLYELSYEQIEELFEIYDSTLSTFSYGRHILNKNILKWCESLDNDYSQIARHIMLSEKEDGKDIFYALIAEPGLKANLTALSGQTPTVLEANDFKTILTLPFRMPKQAESLYIDLGGGKRETDETNSFKVFMLIDHEELPANRIPLHTGKSGSGFTFNGNGLSVVGKDGKRTRILPKGTKIKFKLGEGDSEPKWDSNGKNMSPIQIIKPKGLDLPEVTISKEGKDDVLVLGEELQLYSINGVVRSSTSHYYIDELHFNESK